MQPILKKTDNPINFPTFIIAKKHSMKFFSTLSTVFLLTLKLSFSQSLSPSVISSAGAYFSGGGISLSWTLGETFTATLQNGSTILTQGQQQPYIELKLLNLKLYLQGYYLSAGHMLPVLLYQGVPGASGLETDTIAVELRKNIDPGIVIAATTTVLMTDGNATCHFNAPSDSYWIVVKHRNTIQTWSSNPVPIPSSYDFSSAASKTFANNVVDPLSENIWAFFTGDVNQDEYIDIFDFPQFDIDNQNFVSLQYVPTDFNGDGYVDIFDFPVFDTNNQNFISSIHP